MTIATPSDKASGNAPEMRCYVEAQDGEAAAGLLKQGLGLIESFKVETKI